MTGNAKRSELTFVPVVTDVAPLKVNMRSVEYLGGPANGVLTFTTGGITHLEIERRHGAVLEAEYRRGLRDGKKEI